MSYVDNIRAEMARKRVTQAQMAARLGLSQSSISDRLNKSQDFRVLELLDVAELLNIAPADLVTLI